jgi:uncharacterized protein YndB with AHSA1/START domain
MTAQSGELTLEIKRVFAASPSVVSGALSASDQLAKWWGPEGFTVPTLDFNPRVGDSYRIEMQPPEGDPFYLTGEFREVDPRARLAYTFAWEDPDPDDVETLVELSLRDLGKSTEVVLTQGPFKTEARRELHRNGWTESFDKLEQFVSRSLVAQSSIQCRHWPAPCEAAVPGETSARERVSGTAGDPRTLGGLLALRRPCCQPVAVGM